MTMRMAALVVLGLALAAGSSADGDGGGTGGMGGTGGIGGGGSGGGEVPACGESFTPCGGNPVGTWQLQSCGSIQVRFDLASGDPSCEDLPLTIREEDVQGTLTFAADGTGSADLQVAETYVFDVPAACVAYLGAGAAPQQTCTGLVTTLVDDQGFSGGRCTADAAGACACEVLREYPNQRDFGWTVDGTTLAYDGPSGSSYAFCVEGDVLLRRSLPGGGIEVAEISQVGTRVR